MTVYAHTPNKGWWLSSIAVDIANVDNTAVVDQRTGLDDDASAWITTIDPGERTSLVSPIPRAQAVAVPSVDGAALQLQVPAVQVGFTSPHYYRVISQQPDTAAVTSIDLSLAFRFEVPVTPACSGSSALQALEFAVSKDVGAAVWEWAAQWELNHCPGTGQPRWRLWTGDLSGGDSSAWALASLQQVLTPGVWHHMHMRGDVLIGAVHYTALDCDGVSAVLQGVGSYAPRQVTSRSPDFRQLSVAVQPDANIRGEAYNLFVDQVVTSRSHNCARSDWSRSPGCRNLWPYVWLQARTRGSPTGRSSPYPSPRALACTQSI